MKDENYTLKIADCYESPTNPRGAKFEGKEFDELVASIKEKGVLMPVLARAVGKKYEIVAGNRRFRAAQKAGLTDIPARVVEMTDIEVREAQIVENLQRADVHPLEEGEAYRQLIEQSDYDIAAVAAKVGKPESFVRDRLVLTNLTKVGKAMFRAGDMHAGHAALIARLDEKQQADAVKYLEDETRYGSTVTDATTKDLREWIYDRVFEDSMKNPPWHGDEEMKAALGGCEECNGKGGDLFGKRIADACTNPKCYANRLTAFINIKIAENPALVKLSGNYSASDDLIGSGQRKEINSKKDACDHEEKGIVVMGHDMGRIIRFCRAPECKKHWSSARSGGHYKPTADELAARKKTRAAEKARQEKTNASIIAAVKRVTWPLKDAHLDVLFDTMFARFGYSYMQGVAARHGVKAIKTTKNGYTRRDLDTPLRKHFETAGKDGKAQFLFEVCIQATYDSTERTKLLKKL